LYKIDHFGSFFELTADMSFPAGRWSAITIGSGRSILLSCMNMYEIGGFSGLSTRRLFFSCSC
jgi:hypothetical protein